MSDDYLPQLENLIPGSAARSADINARFSAVSSAFEKLPKPALGKRGFREAVAVGDPINPEDAVNLKSLKNASESGIGAVLIAHEETKVLAAEIQQSQSAIAASAALVIQLREEVDTVIQTTFETLSESLEKLLEPQLSFMGNMVWQNAANAAKIRIIGVN